MNAAVVAGADGTQLGRVRWGQIHYHRWNHEWILVHVHDGVRNHVNTNVHQSTRATQV